ncbi:uncharacterized protein At5g19025-like isoform X2 [Zingiber officinale]|nr:uncharacterized protein At5g19025-like isoform X2 [Zingiber officinale]
MRPHSHSSSSKSSRRHSSTFDGGGGGGHHHHLLPSISICASCKNSPSAATLDLLILLLILFCSAFLTASSLAHVFRSLDLLLPAASFRHAPYPYLAALLLFLAASFAVALLSCFRPCFLPWSRLRFCGRPRCRGLKKALEFDVQLQTEECIRSPDPAQVAALKEIDDLPWKGGQQGNNPDYECLRVELRRMAPPNGRAVLFFRARCGCPLAKLEAWGPKRRHKKAVANISSGGG